jgi:2-keto-4-pentenoate hydratase
VKLRRPRKLSRTRKAAKWLFDEHQVRAPWRPFPSDLAPRSSDEAYLVQDDFVALRADDLGPVVGYKIALTTPQMRKMMGMDSPQAGAIHESAVRRSPAVIRAADYVNLIVEFEIAVEIADDLPAADAPFSRERVAQAVGAVMPAFELLDDRGADYAEVAKRPLELAADNAWNEGAVLGEPVRDWRSIDLGAVRGVATLNGKALGEGRGADAMGHPLDAVAWLAGELAASGRGLLRSEFVITGSLVKTHRAEPGDALEFTVERLGGVELRIE